MLRIIITSIFVLTLYVKSFGWGFWAHQRINRMAVFTLPEEMIQFYKYYILFLTEHSTDPDNRRNVIKEEAPRHYIDLDTYGKNACDELPRKWKDAVAKYSEDSLNQYGIVPWYINKMKLQLITAFKEKDLIRILKTSADIGHYIADAHVPLHTTANYNGQFTNQYGIHGFWESRIPELLGDGFDLFTGKAVFIENTIDYTWNTIKGSHACLDSVFGFERSVLADIGEDKKYSFEDRGNKTTKVYSREFTIGYNEKLNGQVERRMKQSIISVGSFWMTCWIEAGQPDLNELLKGKLTADELEKIKKEEEEWKKGDLKIIDRER